MKKIKNRKGFTLTELLMVIVIIGILAVVAIPMMSRTINTASDRTFYISVSSIVREVRTAVVQDGETNCLYDYRMENGTDSNIESLSVWVHPDKRTGKTIYSVIAKRKGKDNVSINIDDFSQTTTDKSTWIGSSTAKRYSTLFKNEYMTKLIKAVANPSEGSLTNALGDLTLCEVDD